MHSFGCTNAWHLIACFFQGAKRVKPSDAKLEYYARNSRQIWKSPTCTHYSTTPTICWRGGGIGYHRANRLFLPALLSVAFCVRGIIYVSVSPLPKSIKARERERGPLTHSVDSVHPSPREAHMPDGRTDGRTNATP